MQCLKLKKSNIWLFVFADTYFMAFYVCSCHVLCDWPTVQKLTWFLHVPAVGSQQACLPACLPVHWPQNCFYKCRSHCSIALQPNHITRLFSYSREVERRERLMLPLLPIKPLLLVQRQRWRHTGDSPVPPVFLCPPLVCSPLSPSYIIVPHLPSLSRHNQAPCPHPPLHPHSWTNIHQWLGL